jgi:uncharacterized protein YjgD (DUF1641 family)
VVSLNAALALTRSILSTAGQFETLRTQLNAVEKSATKGGDAFAYIKQQAVNTPFQVTNLTQTYIRLRNYGLDPTAGSMQAIIDQAAKLGASRKCWSASPWHWARRGPSRSCRAKRSCSSTRPVSGVGSAVQGHEQVSGRADEDVRKRPAGPEAITALMQAMENDAAGAAASQMQTWNGVVSNATDLWQEFLDSIGQAGLLQFAKDSINQLTAALQKMKETGELSQIAHDIADALQALGKIAGTAKFITHHDAILAVATVYGALAAKLFAGLATDLVTFGTAASKAATALKELKEAQTVGDIVDTVVGKGGVKKAHLPLKQQRPASTKEAAGTVAAVGAAAGGAKTADAASKVGQAASKPCKSHPRQPVRHGGLSAEMTLGGTRLVSVFSAVAMRLGLVTSALLLGYDVVTKVIPAAVDLHKMESMRWNRSGGSWRRLTACSARGTARSWHRNRSVTRVYTAEELASATTAQLKSYRQTSTAPTRSSVDQANHAPRMSPVPVVSDQDPEYQKYLAEAITYAKHSRRWMIRAAG